MTKEELKKEAEVVRLRNEGLDNINKYTRFAETDRKTITKLQQACHKWFMRWREAKKDAVYFDARLQEQIQATLNLHKENAELKEQLKTSYRKGMRHMAKALKDYDRTDGAWTDYFEHTVDKVLQKELVNFDENGTLVDQITKAKELLRKFMPYVREAYLKQDISNIKLSLDEITEAEQFFKYSEVEK